MGLRGRLRLKITPTSLGDIARTIANPTNQGISEDTLIDAASHYCFNPPHIPTADETSLLKERVSQVLPKAQELLVLKPVAGGFLPAPGDRDRWPAASNIHWLDLRTFLRHLGHPAEVDEISSVLFASHAGINKTEEFCHHIKALLKTAVDEGEISHVRDLYSCV